MTAAGDLVVLIPAENGMLEVCGAADLLGRLADDEELDEAVLNSAIDTIEPTPEQLARVRALIVSGDADTYWDLS